MKFSVDRNPRYIHIFSLSLKFLEKGYSLQLEKEIFVHFSLAYSKYSSKEISIPIFFLFFHMRKILIFSYEYEPVILGF